MGATQPIDIWVEYKENARKWQRGGLEWVIALTRANTSRLDDAANFKNRYICYINKQSIDNTITYALPIRAGISPVASLGNDINMLRQGRTSPPAR